MNKRNECNCNCRKNVIHFQKQLVPTTANLACLFICKFFKAGYKLVSLSRMAVAPNFSVPWTLLTIYQKAVDSRKLWIPQIISQQSFSMYFFNTRHLIPLFYSCYKPKLIKHTITDYDMFCLWNNVLAMLCWRLHEVLFQGHFANNNTYSWRDLWQFTAKNN